MILPGRHGPLALVVALAFLLLVAASAAAVQIPATSVEAFPNGRVSNGDLPPNAIDGSTATFTWTTQTNNTLPASLAIGFASSQVNRLRIFKTNDSGTDPTTAAKNLVIQYTTGSGALAGRSWTNVPNLRNGFNGAELLAAGAVNLDGTVSGDNHAGGFASLSFDTVQATGLRVVFTNVITEGSCSINPNGRCSHYRVAEFQAHLDGGFTPPPPAPGPAPDPTPAAQAGVRIGHIGGVGVKVKVRGVNGQVRNVGEGDLIFPGETVFVVGGDDADVEVLDDDGNTFTMQATSQVNSCGNGAAEGLGPGRIQFEGSVQNSNDPDLIGLNPAFGNTCGSLEIESSPGSGTQAVEQATGIGFSLTPEVAVQATGRARVTRDPRRGETTVANLRGSVHLTPASPRGRSGRLAQGRQVRVTKDAVSSAIALVPDLLNEIPSPRQVRAGPAVVTAPSKLSLRSLKSSKCVRVSVSSSRPARVLVSIFSGRRSIRLFGQKQVVFTIPGRQIACIKVPRRAKTFNVRTPLSFAVGYALGARSRPGQRSPAPVVKPIRLIP